MSRENPDTVKTNRIILCFLLAVVGGALYTVVWPAFNKPASVSEPIAASETLAPAPSPSASASPDKGTKSSLKGADLRQMLDKSAKRSATTCQTDKNWKKGDLCPQDP